MRTLTEQQILEGKILIVDDQPVEVMLLEEMLGVAGYTNIKTVTDSRNAVAAYQEFQPDLVCLDINMPHMDGFQVMERLREIEGSRHLPVIVLSARTEQEARLRALGSGARDFLTKPYDMLEVRLRIRSLVEIHLLYKNLIASHAESESLLHNILPEHVAAELKENGRCVPVRYKDVSVMFTDFEGFTRVAAQLGPQQIIEELEVFFTYFDRVIQRYGLLRLKTIGDAYMCAGGVPRSSNTHALDCVLAALDMQRFMDGRAVEMKIVGRDYWGLRIGIHTGPVIAGVVGKERFAYDVWGDTVNVASRIEAAGEAGRVNMSEETYSRVRRFIVAESRGEIPVKNRGSVNMHFVQRLAPELSQDDDGLRPSAAFHDRYQEMATQVGAS